MLETVKKAESCESVVLRMYEFESKRTKAVITLEQPIAKIFELDCLENRKTLIASDAHQFTITLLPYEIKTLELVYL